MPPRIDTGFDDSLHEYRIGGAKVPSVTQVLGDLLPTWQASQWHLDRGRAIHACAAMIARGLEFDHDQQIDGPVAALRKFWAEIRPEAYEIELQVYSLRYRYAGTLDLFALVRATPVLLDYKSSITPAAEYQLAAYNVALQETKPQCRPGRWGIAVEIRENGTYQLAQYDLRPAINKWLNLLSVYNIRRQAGIKETK